MQRNVGSTERVIRISAGILASMAALSGKISGPGRLVLGILGISGVTTGLTRYCPVNQLVGYNGAAAERKRKLRLITSV